MTSNYPNKDFIDYLSAYTPTAGNKCAFDEQLEITDDVEPFQLHNRFKDELLEEFQHKGLPEHGQVFIFAGTAGDGKTWLCRQIFSSFDSDHERWKASKGIVAADCFDRINGRRRHLVFIKDLSEFINNDDTVMQLMDDISAIVSGNQDTVMFVAANNGQLVNKFRSYAEAKKQQNPASYMQAQKLLAFMEARFLHQQQPSDDRFPALRIYDLQQTCNRDYMQQALQAVLEHSSWQRCAGCTHQKYCPIYGNRNQVKEQPLFQSRLLDLMCLVMAAEQHITTRDLLMLLANMILGIQKGVKVPGGKKVSQIRHSILRCSDAVLFREDSSLHLYSNVCDNVFGYNLPDSKYLDYHIFAYLNTVKVGQESNKLLDDFLIYGDDSDSYEGYQDYFPDKWLRQEIHKKQLSYQQFCQDNDKSAVQDKYSAYILLLQNLRRRLFFSLPDDNALKTSPWNLTAYFHGGVYLKLIHAYDNRIKAECGSLLIEGLNIVFTGFYVSRPQNDHDSDAVTNLYAAETGGFTSANFSKICPHDNCLRFVDSPESTYKAEVSLSLTSSALPCIEVHVPKRPAAVQLMLTPERFEFLACVASGTIPTSFSRECLEDIKNFKAQILAALDSSKNRSSDDKLRLIQGFGKDGNLEAVSVILADKAGAEHDDR